MKITVFGSARLGPETPEYRDAVRLGRMLAVEGHILLNGGYGGLMEATSRGAHEAGGKVIGITMAPWEGRLIPNQYLSQQRAAKTLFARIKALIRSDCLLALPGGAGTLGEVALAWNLLQMDLMPATPVVLVGPGWQAMTEAFREHLIVNTQDLAMLKLVPTVDSAVETVNNLSREATLTPAWRG